MVSFDVIIQIIQTAALVITMGVVIWYTVETSQMRKAMTEQNRFLFAEIEPCFGVGDEGIGGNFRDGGWVYFLTNKGGMAKIVSIESDDFTAKILNLTPVIRNGEKLQFHVSLPPQEEKLLSSEEYHFKISYKTKLNEPRDQKFCIYEHRIIDETEEKMPRVR